MKILLVEDHPGSRRNLQRLIERRGHEVVALATAEEAEAALVSEEFPFVILDWVLPGKSGVEFCRELRAQPDGDEIFVLLVTGRSDPADLTEALEAGANDYLVKPFDMALLDVRLSVAEQQIRALAERNKSRAALRKSAHTISSILEKTADGFFEVDSEWNFTCVNPKAAFLLGRTQRELLGENFWKKFPELCGSLFEKNYRKIMSDDLALEFEATDPDGKAWYEVHAYRSDGGLSVFLRDITERKRTEDERLKTSKLESLGTLAGGIAHDLNNILTVISGNIGLAQIEVGENESNFLPYLSKAGEAAQHAARLSCQLLTFAKGGAPLKRIVALGQLLEQAAEFSLRGSNLRAEIEITDDLWKVEIDAGQVEQVMNALILNAREAMPDGGKVRVSARNYAGEEETPAILPPGRFVKVTVSDGGGGISSEIASKIFDPYFTTKALGSGLGLSISYSIVKRHGGVLQLESSSPDGSTFAFYLPATKRKASQSDGRVTKRVPRLNPQRVLVMDDDAAVRELTSQLLRTLGYEVEVVADGLEAVKVYERALRRGENFQAVILDATVRGGMGGVAAIEQLRNLDPHVIAIICSGYSDEAALSQFLAYGFRGALPKPFTRGELGEVIQRAVASRSLN
jgi:PAS domain S-box-containing protein